MGILLNDARHKISLKYLRVENTLRASPHQIWTATPMNRIDILRACTKARVLVGRYYLQADMARFTQSSDVTCPLCQHGAEDLYHFICSCSALKDIRERYLHDTKPVIIAASDVANWYKIIQSPTLMTQVILDSTVMDLGLTGPSIRQMETLSRCLIYALHSRREAILRAKRLAGGGTEPKT